MSDQDNIYYRMDGRVEMVCEHGTGHTIDISNVLYVDWDNPKSIAAWWTHGCCGCCDKWQAAESVEPSAA